MCCSAQTSRHWTRQTLYHQLTTTTDCTQQHYTMGTFFTHNCSSLSLLQHSSRPCTTGRYQPLRNLVWFSHLARLHEFCQPTNHPTTQNFNCNTRRPAEYSKFTNTLCSFLLLANNIHIQWMQCTSWCWWQQRSLSSQMNCDRYYWCSIINSMIVCHQYCEIFSGRGFQNI